MAHLESTEFPDHIKNFVTACDDGSFLPITTPTRFLPDIQKMDIRPSDIMVVTWPKSGTSWMQYMVTQLVDGEDVLNENVHLFQKNIFLEVSQNPLKVIKFHFGGNIMGLKLLSPLSIDESDGMYKLAENLPSPRLLKSHLKMSMLPTRLLDSKAKVIYVVRNPKDAAVSFYHFCLKLPIYPLYKDWSEFFEYFCNGLLPYGDWFEHVLPWWEKRNEPNVLFMKYEVMKKNCSETILCLSKFLEKPLSAEQLEDINERSSFNVMKENTAVNPDLKYLLALERAPIPFMRKGEVGDWKNFFTVAQNERFDKLYRQKMEGSGLELDFE